VLFEDTAGLLPDTVYFYLVRVKCADGTEPQWAPMFSGKTEPESRIVDWQMF